MPSFLKNDGEKVLPQLGIYFFTAYLIAWAAWVPSFLNPDLPKLLPFAGLFAPALAAIAVTYLTGKKNGVKNLFARYKILRFPVWWYIFAIFFVPLLFLIALSADSIFFHVPLKNLVLPQSPILAPVSFFWLMFINSGEEIGWRGFALPKLQKVSRNPVYTSLILGIIWSLWHLPIYLVPGQSSIPLHLFLFFTIGLSFIYTVLFNATRGSLVPVVLLHASTDVIPRIVNISLFSNRTWLIFGVLTWSSAIVLMLIFRKNRGETTTAG